MSRLVLVVLVLASCSGGTDDDGLAIGDTSSSSTATTTTTSTTTTTTSTTADTGGCADVIGASLSGHNDTYVVMVTVRSADAGWDKYADSWEIRDEGGEVLGERVLTHPHEDEQPFTRSLSGVVIPPSVSEVTIAAHDSVAGFCGEVLVMGVPGR